MPPCPCCGTPTPSPERIQPLGIQMEKTYSRGPAPVFIGERPTLIPWLCPGARFIDMGLLRFGIIARAPGSCGAPRSTRWGDTTFDLRRRALDVQLLRLGLKGWI